MNEKKSKTLLPKLSSSFLWVGSSYALNALVHLITLMILSHLLEPADFGIIVLANIIVIIGRFISNLGLDRALVQTLELREEHITSSFWAGIVMSIFCTIILWCNSKILAEFFNNANLIPVLHWLSAIFLLSTFGGLPRAILERKLNFAPIAIAEIIGIVIYSLSSIILAYLGYGVFSLVIGYLLQRGLESIFLFYFSKWKIRFSFDWKALSELLPFARNVMGEQVIGYLTTNIDFWLVGKLLGTTQLGYYSLAYMLATLSGTRIAPIVTRVMYPVFCNFQKDEKRLRSLYQKTIRLITFLCLPFITGLGAVAIEFIRLGYGEKWTPVIIPLQILLIVGFLKAIATSMGLILHSKGRSDLGLAFTLWQLLALGLSIYFMGKCYGLWGVAWAYALIVALFFIPTQYLTNRLIKLSLKEYLDGIGDAIFSSLSMLILLLFYRYVITKYIIMNQLILLISMIILGIIIYVMLSFYLQKKVLSELKEWWRQLKSSRKTNSS